MENTNNTINRLLFLTGYVEEANCHSLTKEIISINQHDDKMEKERVKYEREPITLYVDSFGGDAYSGYGLYTAIKMSKTPIHTICISKAMSMGFLILVGGHKRFAAKDAHIMYHDVACWTGGKRQDIKESVEEMQVLMDMYDGVVLERTNLLKEKLDDVKLKKQNWYMRGEEAKKHGIVDELISAFPVKEEKE